MDTAAAPKIRILHYSRSGSYHMVQRIYPEINIPEKQSMSTEALSFKCSGPHFPEQTKDTHQLIKAEK